MPLYAKLRSLVENVFCERRVEAELDQEVRSHLEMLVREHLESGMTPAEAQRRARARNRRNGAGERAGARGENRQLARLARLRLPLRPTAARESSYLRGGGGGYAGPRDRGQYRDFQRDLWSADPAAGGAGSATSCAAGARGKTRGH